MFNEITKEIKWGEETLVLSTGKIARQASGSVMISLGKTQVLCTVCVAPTVNPEIDFFPLSVHYREMSYAAGKIPGGFVKREGKPSEREVLVSRFIDRAIRPLFSQNFYHETQIICTVLSYDPANSCDIVSMIGAYAAVAISGVQLLDIPGSAKVGMIKNQFVLNPSSDQLANSELDLIVSATSSSVMMVEAQGSQISYDKMLEAIEFGHQHIKPVIELIKDFQLAVGKNYLMVENLPVSDLEQNIITQFHSSVEQALGLVGKQQQEGAIAQILRDMIKQFPDQAQYPLSLILKKIKAKILRQWILEQHKRIDGRKIDEIRPISCEVSLLAKTHGSSLFTRGETQALAVTTLGGASDEQIVDNLEQETRERFILHYIFPPYAVNETSSMKAPGRREIGHGKLAWRAIYPLLPSKFTFPYTIRTVAEICESNGSSSMATVCAGALSMLDAGVPLKAPVAGIAMGLIKQDDKFVILSDIIAEEDYLGDMDFKVAGTQTGITALQMDIKIAGIDMQIMKQALLQAQSGIEHILSIMNNVLAAPSDEARPNAPVIHIIKIAKEKIKEIIGPGGKIIKEICESTHSKIDIADDGSVKIFAASQEFIDMAVERITAIGLEPEIGKIYDAKVVKIIDIGVIVKFFAHKESLIHVNDILISKGQDIHSYFKIGDSIAVKFIGYDSKKRHRVTMRIEGVKPEQDDVESVEVVSEKKYFS